MKSLSYLAFTILSVWYSSADIPKPSFLTSRSVLSIRGGDLGPVKSKSLSQMFTIFPTLDAVTCSFAPLLSVSQVGIEIEKGSFNEFLVQVAGAHAAGVALTNYLATTGKTSINEAIGYGVLARFILGVRVFLTHLDIVKNINPLLPVLGVGILPTCAYSMISGELDPSLCGKFLASLLALLGVTVFISPEFLANKVFNTDIVKGGNTKLILKTAAMYLLVGSLQIGLYQMGIKPDQSISYMSIFCIPFVLLMPDVLSIENYAGMSLKKWSALSIAILFAFAYGTLA